MAWRRHEMEKTWHGGRVRKLADRIFHLHIGRRELEKEKEKERERGEQL